MSELYVTMWVTIGGITKRVDVKVPDTEAIIKGEWKEELHPRDDKGRFTDKPDTEESAKPEQASVSEGVPPSFKIYDIMVSYRSEDYNPNNKANHQIIEAALKRALAVAPENHRNLIKQIIIDDDITNDINPLSNKRVLSEEELKSFDGGRRVGAYSIPEKGIMVFNASADPVFFSGKGAPGVYDNIVLHEIGHFAFVKEFEGGQRSLVPFILDFDLLEIAGELSKYPNAEKELLSGNESSNFREAVCGLYRNYILNGARLKEMLPKSYGILKRKVFGGREYISKAFRDLVPLYIYRVKSGARIYSLEPLPEFEEGRGE